jgi:hypothetical protein
MLDLAILTALLKTVADFPQLPDPAGHTPGTVIGEAHGLAGQLEEAFNQIGTSMQTDGFSCKLMAYVLQMGGGNEAVVHHPGLNAGIQIAQQKLGLYGGCVPNIKLLALFQKYNKELERDMEKCEWLHEIYERYDLTPTGQGKNKK